MEEQKMKNTLTVSVILLLASVFLGITCPFGKTSKGSFPDAVQIFATEFKLYAEPDSKGKILKDSFDGSALYVDPKPITNNNDNSQWYKVIYYWPYGDLMLRQVNKMPAFNKNFAYVNARDVTTKLLEDYVKKEIDSLRAGRPPQHKVGDSLDVSEEDIAKLVIIEFTAAGTLLLQPREDAQTINVPKGLKCLGPIYASEDSFPVCYANMEEENWAMIVDAKTKKVLGWIKPEKLNKISKWIEPKF
jgi:hypothetical protein